MVLNVIFYCPIIKKKIPGTLVINNLFRECTEYHLNLYVVIKYDFSKFGIFSLKRDEVYRYSKQVVDIKNVYPYNTQSEKDYADSVIPKYVESIITDHQEKELNRYETIITELINVNEISYNMFYSLCEFLSFEVLFELCDLTDRIFFQTMSAIQLTEQPDPVRVPQIVRLLKLLFDKFSVQDIQFKIIDFDHFKEFDYLSFPIVINIVNLEYNINYITI